MAHLDLDTADLLATARRTRDAAGLLADAAIGHLGPGAGAGAGVAATGDATLADAVDAVLTAWAPTHRALLATMERLADGLAAAGEAFESAEQLTAAQIAGAVPVHEGPR